MATTKFAYCRICVKMTKVTHSVLEGKVPKMIESLTGIKVNDTSEIRNCNCCKNCFIGIQFAYQIQQQILSSNAKLHRQVKALDEEMPEDEDKSPSHPRFVLNECDSSKKFVVKNLKEMPTSFIKNLVLQKQVESNSVKVNFYRKAVQPNVIYNESDQSVDNNGSTPSGPSLLSECEIKIEQEDVTSEEDPLKLEENMETSFDNMSATSKNVKSSDDVNKTLGDVKTSPIMPENKKLIAKVISQKLNQNHTESPINNNEKSDELNIKIEVTANKNSVDSKTVKVASPVLQEECLNQNYIEQRKPGEQIEEDPAPDFFYNTVVPPLEREQSTTPSIRKKFNEVDYSESSTKKPCDVCGFKVEPAEYQDHMKECHPEDLPLCEICGQTLSTNGSLKNHIKKVHKLYNIVCEKCGKQFKDNVKYLKHKKRHIGIRDVICGTCTKGFYTLKDLDKHHKTAHLKLRPYICSYCKKGYSTRYARKCHLRTHTNETPFRCDICAEGFRYKVSLQTHMVSKHKVKEEANVKCEYCEKMFTTEQALETHTRVHTDGMLKCPFCTQIFMKKNLLKEHVDKEHENDKDDEEEGDEIVKKKSKC